VTPSTPDLTQVWDAHVAAEFQDKDADAAVATMCDDATLLHVPVATGARGKDQLRRFYADVFIPSWPDDLAVETVSRTVDDARVVEELIVRGTHDRPMPFWLPGVAPTERRFEVAHAAVVSFRDRLIASEHIYWDQASLLVQLGLFDPTQGGAESLPVLGVAQTRAYADPTYPLNELIERVQRAER
jgi:carboxymethylenebutenolidase